jgi:hypothetical protein
MKILKWGCFLLIIIVITFAYDKYTQHTTSSAVVAAKSTIAHAPVVDEAIVVGIELPPGQEITKADVFAGKYPLLALRLNTNTYTLYLPNRIGHLRHFDGTKDDMIDAADPIFNKFAFAYFNPKNNTIHFVPAINVGLRTIILYSTTKIPLPVEYPLPPAEYVKLRGAYVMSDGSQWTSFHLPLPTSFLDQLKTDPNSNQKIVFR